MNYWGLPIDQGKMTLLELIERPPTEAVAISLPEDGLRLTYGELSIQVRRIAKQLSGVGIGRNDRVAIALGNGLPAVISILAASVAGTAAPLNPGYRKEEFDFYLKDTDAKLLITGEEVGDAVLDLNNVPSGRSGVEFTEAG